MEVIESLKQEQLTPLQGWNASGTSDPSGGDAAWWGGLSRASRLPKGLL